VEVGGDGHRIGTDPVGSAARGGLADLVGELEQALDQLLLGGLQRLAGGGVAARLGRCPLRDAPEEPQEGAS